LPLLWWQSIFRHPHPGNAQRFPTFQIAKAAR
jgi:hypothetical protein